MTLPLPELFRYAVPERWHAIEFVSDLHLSEAQPRTFDAFAAYLGSTTADAVFVLGDLFEAWIGDDARIGGFERLCAGVLEAAARRCRIGFMAGNRDFLVGEEFLRETGVTILPDPTLLDAWGSQILLTHGDRLCLGDREYQRFRLLVRSREWQRDFLARPLAERRELARQMRDASEQVKMRRPIDEWADVDAEAAIGWLREAGAQVMVHGHTHRPGSAELGPGFVRHVLTDWDMDGDVPRAEALVLTRSGFARRRLTP